VDKQESTLLALISRGLRLDTARGDEQMERKNWIRSRTLWVNAVAFIALVVQNFTGFVVGVEEQAALLALVNLGLRLITHSGLSVGE
jgi:hypothetical protein